MGNHNIGVMCLGHLIQRGHEIAAVIGIPEDPDEVKYYDSVLGKADQLRLQTYAPKNVNNSELVAVFRELAPDLIVVISYRQILRKPIIDIPRLGVINLHGALLPKFRGGSPINWAIINGESETGVTIHYIDEGVDTGPIIAQRRIPITCDDTAVTLFEKVTNEGFELFKQVVYYFETGSVPTIPNRKEEGSYYRRRTPDQGVIDWKLDATSIYNLIRALVPPFPGAFSYIRGRKMTVEWGVPLAVSKEDTAPGELFRFTHSGQYAVAAGSGSILLNKVNLDGFGSGTPEELFPRADVIPGLICERS